MVGAVIVGSGDDGGASALPLVCGTGEVDRWCSCCSSVGVIFLVVCAGNQFVDTMG